MRQFPHVHEKSALTPPSQPSGKTAQVPNSYQRKLHSSAGTGAQVQERYVLTICGVPFMVKTAGGSGACRFVLFTRAGKSNTGHIPQKKLEPPAQRSKAQKKKTLLSATLPHRRPMC